MPSNAIHAPTTYFSPSNKANKIPYLNERDESALLSARTTTKEVSSPKIADVLQFTHEKHKKVEAPALTAH